jgi:hypothetical protein
VRFSRSIKGPATKKETTSVSLYLFLPLISEADLTQARIEELKQKHIEDSKMEL